MNCTFPSKRERKQVFSKQNVKPMHCNIKTLKNNNEVVKSYSDALDKALENCSSFDDINELSDKITTSIQISSEKNYSPQ